MNTTIQTKSWFFSAGGQVKGPITLEEFCKVLRTGALDSNHDMGWNETMADWRPLSQIAEISHALKHAKKRSKIPFSSQARNQGFGGPSVLPDSPSRQTLERQKLSASANNPVLKQELFVAGISRGNFLGSLILLLLGVVGLAILYNFFQPSLPGSYSWTVFLVPGAVLLAGIYGLRLCAKRFVNAGMSPWWLIGLLFVPIVNLWALFRLVAAPTNYTHLKKMDAMGYALSLLYLTPILGAIGLAAYIYTSGFQVDSVIEGTDYEILNERIDELKNAVPAESFNWPA